MSFYYVYSCHHVIHASITFITSRHASIPSRHACITSHHVSITRMLFIRVFFCYFVYCSTHIFDHPRQLISVLWVILSMIIFKIFKIFDHCLTEPMSLEASLG